MQYTIKCKDCDAKATFTARTLRSYYDKARDNGWAISADYVNKWCPNCAPLHRHVGRNGSRSRADIPDNWNQLKIENL